MIDSAHSQNQTKGEYTRMQALEKEIVRLKTLSQKQSVKHNKFKKIASFQLLFFVLLLIMMFTFGIIQWPVKQNTAINTTPPPVATADTAVIDTTTNDLISHEPLFEIQGEDMISFYVPEDGLLFSIQIGAYTGVDMRPYETNMFSLRQYTYQNINQFTVGIFQDFKDAEAFQNIIQQMGFHDAFIIATLNGKRLPIQEALSIKNRQQAAPQNAMQESPHSESDPFPAEDQYLP